MQVNNPQTQPVDPLLRQAFQVIKQTPLRLAQDRRQGLQNFVREADVLFSEVNGDEIINPSQPKFSLSMIKDVLGLTNLKMRPLFTALSAILLACVFLFGGVGMTAYAAQSALPGDSLYAVKTSLEATRASLVKDQVKQIELYLNFAQLRLDEISALIQSGRYMDIPQATAEFETYLDKALAALQLLAQNDPVRAAAYNFQVADTFSRFNQILSGMLVSVPASVHNAMISAIDASATLSKDDSLDDGQDEDILDDDQDDDSLDDGQDDGQDDNSLDDNRDDGQDDDNFDSGQDDGQDDNSLEDNRDDGQDDDSLDDGQDDDQDDDGQNDDSHDNSLDDDQVDDQDDGEDDDGQDDDGQNDDSHDDSLDDGQDGDGQVDDSDVDSNQDSQLGSRLPRLDLKQA